MPSIKQQDYSIIIKKYLPEDLWAKALNFSIPADYVQSMPELIELVLRSRSMDKDEEKQSWFNLMPLMNEEQITKLNDILTREKQKLQEIEKKYEQKKIEIKKKYLLKRQNMGYIKNIQDIQDKEASNRESDVEEAENLLEAI